MTVPLKEMAMKPIDVLVITKTKLDDTFPTSQLNFAGTFILDPKEIEVE